MVAWLRRPCCTGMAKVMSLGWDYAYPLRGTPGRNRTCSLPVRSRALFLLSFRGKALPVGLEPTTLRVEAGCSSC